MNIAVVDEGRNLVSHVRMDGAWIGSVDISSNKAFTSRAFDISTKDLAQYSLWGSQLFGIHVSNIQSWARDGVRRRIPLKRGGKVVGAVGVSGGSGEQDHTVAEAGAKHSRFFVVAAHSRTPWLRRIFLRKQLALFQERKVKPRRADDATRWLMATLGRMFPWRNAPVNVKPDTLICWQHKTIPALLGAGNRSRRDDHDCDNQTHEAQNSADAHTQ
jgi:uncharacterized protein GlcG (DUF336 family)